MRMGEGGAAVRADLQWESLRGALEGGMVRRSSELIAAGIRPAAIADALRRGRIARLAPGAYHLPDNGADGWEAALAAACSKTPRAIACMATAGRLNGLLDPGKGPIWLALSASAHPGTAGAFPRRILRWTRAGAMDIGVGELRLRGVTVRATNPARTVVDLFRFSRLLEDDAAPIAAARRLAERPGQLQDALEIASRLEVPRQAMIKLRTVVETLR